MSARLPAREQEDRQGQRLHVNDRTCRSEKLEFSARWISGKATLKIVISSSGS